MRYGPVSLLSALALVTVGCATTRIPCEGVAGEVRRMQAVTDGQALQFGELYLFEGLMYSEFEDAGLILTSLKNDAALSILEDLKWRAFCFRWERGCAASMDQYERDRGKRVRVARVGAAVRYLGSNERGADGAVNQCRQGTLEVVSFVVFRPLVEAALPIGLPFEAIDAEEVKEGRGATCLGNSSPLLLQGRGTRGSTCEQV